MWGKPFIIAISLSLIIGTTGINPSPVYGGGSFPFCSPPLDTCFDNGNGSTGGDGLWTNADNWNNGLPGQFDNMGIGYETLDGLLPPESAVIPTGANIIIDDTGSLTLISDTTLTIQTGATLDHQGTPTITISTGSSIIVEGTFLNSGNIVNDGEILCQGGGTFSDTGSVTGSGTITGCGGAAVGSISIPIDSTSLLVAESQSFSWMIPVLLSAIGIGLFVVSRKSENSKI